jgi:hypothetical protein
LKEVYLFISRIFAGLMIREEFGKLAAIHPFLFPTQMFFPSEPISLSRGGKFSWLGFSSISPLSGSAWLGSLSSTAVRYLGSGNAVGSNFIKKIRFQVNLCYHGADWRIRLKEKKF